MALADLIAAGRVRYVRNSPPLRQAGNVNRLFDLAAGEFLALLHDDDLLLPDAVASLAACFDADPALTAAFGKQYLVDADGRVDEAGSDRLNADYRRTAAEAGRQPSAVGSAVATQFPNDGYLVRTDVARRVRYRDDPAVGDACDLDFGLRLAAVADGFYFLDRYTAKYRVTGASVSAGNNYTHLTFDLLAGVTLPPQLEPLRQERLARYAPQAVNRWLTLGDRRRAWQVFTSAAYPWRRRLSPRGLVQAGLLALPPGLARRVVTTAKRVRGR